MARYRFWFHDRDKKGQPLDDGVLKAAEEIAPLLARYRQQEIDCESTTNDILQTAVEAASNATRNKPIANPSGYLVSVYRRFVDKFLDHKRKTIAVGDDFLEDLANVEHSPAPSFEEWMHNHILLEQLIELMEPETQRICRWRLEGYSEAEIANRLGVTPNAVSVRFTRGFKEAAKNLLRGKRSTKRK
jgi:RNA polymerase sigma factor (sigma-70 family)